jgi:PTS system mannitol-specific IIA component
MAVLKPLTSLLAESSILLDVEARDVDDAIRQVGAVLVATGAVAEHYVQAMLERERSVSTFVGEGIAMPHGTLAAKDSVTSDAIAVLRLPQKIDWNGEAVDIVIGIAAEGGGHIALMSQLATVLLVPGRAQALRAATTASDVYAVLAADDPHDV